MTRPKSGFWRASAMMCVLLAETAVGRPDPAKRLLSAMAES
jgi:hypothetical protein